MSKHHARPAAYPAAPGTVPGELRGRAGAWYAEQGQAAAGAPHSTSEHLSVMANPPGWARGWQDSVIIPNPALGAVWSYTVDGRYSERLVSARWTLTTSAVVANRFPVLQLLDTNGRIVAVRWAGGTIAASLALGVTLAGNVTIQSNYGGNEVFGPMPDFITPPGYTWRATVQGIDAGDQQSAITLFVDRFPSDTTRKYEPVDDDTSGSV